MLRNDELEYVERTAFSIVTTAIENYKEEIVKIFREEEDKPQDIAEDIVREAIEELGMSRIRERLYGKVDLKKSIYVFLPEAVPVALMVDAKAEKHNGDRTATIQMSQTSMRVKVTKQNRPVDEQGKLETVITRGSNTLYVVTIVVKFAYVELTNGHYDVRKIILACIPSGRLQDKYNPDPDDTIWQMGRDSPKRGEDFRIRVSFTKLAAKAGWRICEIPLAESEG